MSLTPTLVTHHAEGDGARLGTAPPGPRPGVTVRYPELLRFTAEVFATRGLPAARARTAAEALLYGDLTGLTSHGLVNLTRLYLPLLDEGRADPGAEPEVLADLGAAVLLDDRRALGLWAAPAAMDLAVERAERHGVGLVSVRGATHLGCAGFHTLRAARRGLIGLVTANCGRQRIARPPGGRTALLGTNPLSVAAPAGERLHPFVLDMSTTAVPTGRVRAAARAGQQIPAGWLADQQGDPVTDPAAFDRGEAHLLWLGGSPQTGAYKGYGLGLVVEVLGALLAGAGLGPEPAALTGDGRPSGRDDDIGYLALSIAPGTLRDGQDFARQAGELFGTLLDCPPVDPANPVGYPGHPEGELAERQLIGGVHLAPARFQELTELAADCALTPPRPIGATGQAATE
ncbi:LDH2 family malate/lactate/ureidoglycolate dehydrogenase [Kitasatospora sp. GP30]|uniref:Ldh family oxidoreductase n=1 Tax=Kitasatospora sp. GP30 TaxID=3035084 RepID=UPI000C705103|nr:Ldh family oxidoreductase [Kitasatospora sp. GP30]MDH6138148.1 LDH2 family malate/lactate/ureidoglycolate dehydrogenase [Kitasatospora sp. GP30]